MYDPRIIKATARWEDIDRAKGLAILLVVIGHLASAGGMPPGAEWYAIVKSVIYRFHMVFFMFLSGFVFFLSQYEKKAWPDYKGYLLGRLARFLPAYAFFGALEWGGKLVSKSFIYVDNPSKGLADLVPVFLTPTISVASSLWYVWVLMLFHILTPLLIRTWDRLGFWLVVSLPLSFVSMTYWLGLNQATEYLFIFLLGGFLARNHKSYLHYLERFWPACLIIFMLSLAVGDYSKVFAFIISLLSIPALHGLVRWGWLSSWRWMEFIGRRSYPIYLMNTIAMGITKGVIMKFTTWGGVNFFWVLPLLVSAGTLFPIIIKREVFSRIYWLDRITT
jgi:fucose 4-O-acetylase-like acetyltransferase